MIDQADSPAARGSRAAASPLPSPAVGKASGVEPPACLLLLPHLRKYIPIEGKKISKVISQSSLSSPVWHL